MTPNPQCATVDTPLVDALHIMHDGKFLHLPIVDRGVYMFNMGLKVCLEALEINDMTSYVLGQFNVDGIVVAVTDVLHITHAAVATVS